MAAATARREFDSSMMQSSTSAAPARWLTWLLYSVFFASGVSGLMYEVVWVRMLTRVLGSTAYATSTVLAVFMAGLGLGSFVIGRFVDRVRNPLAWYAGLEVGIGVTAFLSLMLPERLVPLYRMIYTAAGDSRPMLTAGQVAIAVAVLLIPTTLMGATLPTLCTFGARRMTDFSRTAATLYAVNTLGAVLGVLAAGFLFLGTIGETNTIAVGALLNLLAAAIAWSMSRSAAASAVDQSQQTAATREADEPSRRRLPAGLRGLVWLTFSAAGFIALANEVLWGRMLILCQGTSIYAFSSMLAVALMGIGCGSLIVGRFADRLRAPVLQLARVQFGIAIVSCASLYLYGWLGRFPEPSLRYGTDLHWLLIAPLVLLGPLSFLWGATFPLAVRCYGTTAERAGREVSLLYVGNTLGSILGAAAAGFWLIGRFGVSRSAIGLALASAVAGLVLFFARPGRSRISIIDLLLIVICITAWLRIGDPYYQLIYDRLQKWFQGKAAYVYEHIEEPAGTTTAFGLGNTFNLHNKRLNTYRQLWVNGQGMTTLCTEAKLMAHMPLALVDDPKSILVICFGMGTTVRSAALHDDVDVTAVELLPGVIECFKYYHPDAKAILDQPNISIHADDGRNFLLMRDERYDVITIDPAPPFFSAGTVNLYTREFFELVKSRLNPGGVLCLWLPPANEVEAKMVVRSFLDVFPHTDVWTGATYKGLFLIGSEEPFEDVPAKIHRIYQNPKLVVDLTEWDPTCATAEQVLDLYISAGDAVQKLYQDVPAVTDDRPYTEFPLLRVINEHEPIELNGDRLRSELGEK